MNALAATDLCASINLTLGWRASDPAFDPQRLAYTGGVVLSQRGAEAIVHILDHTADLEAEVIRTARRELFVPTAELDVFIALLDVPCPVRMPDLPKRYTPPTVRDH